MKIDDKELQEIRDSAQQSRRMKGAFIDAQEHANDCERLISTIEGLKGEVERYRNFLIEFRRLTPYGMYHEMIDTILGDSHDPT